MLLIADNLQIANTPLARAIAEEDPAPLQELVRRCVASGADAIDVNTGPLPRDAARAMRFVVEAVQAATGLPLILDTANPEAMAAGLAACRNRAIINGYSLEPSKIEKMLPLAARFDAEIIGYLLRPDGHVPASASERLALALDLVDALKQAGGDAGRLIVDPVIGPLMWENGLDRNRGALEVLQRLPELLDFPVRTIAGLSNLTAGAGSRPQRLLVERAFVPMLAAAGLDMLMLNIQHRETVCVARASRLLRRDSVFTWAALDGDCR